MEDVRIEAAKVSAKGSGCPDGAVTATVDPGATVGPLLTVRFADFHAGSRPVACTLDVPVSVRAGHRVALRDVTLRGTAARGAADGQVRTAVKYWSATRPQELVGQAVAVGDVTPTGWQARHDLGDGWLDPACADPPDRLFRITATLLDSTHEADGATRGTVTDAELTFETGSC